MTARMEYALPHVTANSFKPSREDYASLSAWQEDWLIQHETEIDPVSKSMLTLILPPRKIQDWLMANMTLPYRFRYIGGAATGRLRFGSNEDAQLYRLRWL